MTWHNFCCNWSGIGWQKSGWKWFWGGGVINWVIKSTGDHQFCNPGQWSLKVSQKRSQSDRDNVICSCDFFQLENHDLISAQCRKSFWRKQDGHDYELILTLFIAIQFVFLPIQLALVLGTTTNWIGKKRTGLAISELDWQNCHSFMRNTNTFIPLTLHILHRGPKAS